MTATFEFSPEGFLRDMKRALYGLLAFAAIVGVAHCGSGCKPAQAPNDLEQAYTAEIVACAATAGYPGAYDRDADLRCRAEVDCRYKLGPCR